MSNLRIVSDNAADRATLTASSTAGALAVANLQTDTKSDVWRATGIAASIYAAWPTPETVQAVALPFCNLSPTATMRVRLTNEPAVTNMLTTSEAMSASPWTRTNCIATPCATTAPDGSFNAQFVREDVTAGVAHELRTPTISLAAGTPYAMSVFAKQGTRRYVRVGFSSVFSAVAFSAYVIFDLQTGAISSSAGAGVTGAITSYGNGWYRCVVFFIPSKATSGTNYIGLQSDAVTTTYTGDGVSGLYLWGAQLEAVPSTLGSELITNGTFDYTINGWTVTVAGTSSVNWSSTGGGAAALAGDGSNNANLSQSFATVPGATYCVSFSAASLGVLMRVGTTVNSSNVYSSGTINVGTYAITFVATSTTSWLTFARGSTGSTYIDNVSVKQLAYTPAATSYYPSADAFTSRASTATYMSGDGTLKVAANDVARWTYNPNNLSAPPKLRLEVASTNLVTASGTLTTGWSGNASVTPATGTTYRGFDTYQVLAKTTSGSNEQKAVSVGTVSAGGKLTATIALRAGAVTTVSVGLYDTTSGGPLWGANADSVCLTLEGPGTVGGQNGGLFLIANLSATVDTVVQITRNYVNASTGASFIVYPDSSASTVLGASILATRVQVEAQTWPSSYIPTTTAAVTRAADVWASPLGTRPPGFIDGWQSYAYDSGAAPACPAPAVTLRGWTAAQAASAYAYGGGAFARTWLPAAVQAYGMAVDIVDTNNLQGYVEAARLVAGPYWSPAYNASDATMTSVDTTELYRTDAGDQGANAGYTYRRVPVSLSAMPASDRAALAGILRNSRAYPILLSLFPGSADLSLERDNMVYGRRSKDADVAIQYAAAYSTTIEIEEI